MFQPNFYCATHSDAKKLYFCNDIDEKNEKEGFVFHCQYFHEKNIFYDFRVEAAKRLKSCQALYSKEDWEEYFTVTTRYPRTSAHSTDHVDWNVNMILALHASAASTGCNTLFEYMHKRWTNGNCGIAKKSEIVIREITGDPNCSITWEVVASDKGDIDPIKLILLPKHLNIFSKFLSTGTEMKPFVVQYGSNKKIITYSSDKGVADLLKLAQKKFNVRKLKVAKTDKGDLITNEILFSLPKGSVIHVN